jgi:hypothetical protein
LTGRGPTITPEILIVYGYGTLRGSSCFITLDLSLRIEYVGVWLSGTSLGTMRLVNTDST